MAERDSNVLRFGIQRKIVATMTTESWRHVPHVSFVYEPDVTRFVEAYKKFDEETPYKLTFNTAMLKAIAEGVKANPAMNAHIHYELKLVRGKLKYFDNIDISVPWTLPDGNMMTITMKDVGNKSLQQMAEYTEDINRRLKNTNLTEALYSVSIHDTIKRLTDGHVLSALQRLYGSKTNPRHKVVPLKGQAKKDYYAIPETDRLTKDDLDRGTVCVSNIGSTTRGVPGRVTLLAIIPPEVFVICMGAIQKIPMVKQDENGNDIIVPGQMLPMCCVFDHRAVDFDEIVPFINRMEQIFHHPEEIFNW